MLKGRLGLESARIPHADRHGLLWLDRGRLEVVDGCLSFSSAGGELSAGNYQIPHQMVSMILLGPGSSVTHDALRILARHGTGICAVGDGGVRLYTFPPLGPDSSALSRRQVELWANDHYRAAIARRMYVRRFGDFPKSRDLNVLRGIEGARSRESYRLLAERFSVPWEGRRYNRNDPESTDMVNQAINHAATAVEAAASISVASVGAIPQLGFIHEDSGLSFVLDIADLIRQDVTIPIAFRGYKQWRADQSQTIERFVRLEAGKTLRELSVVSKLIDEIKLLFEPFRSEEI